MKITWIGHSAFRIDFDEQILIFDFIGNKQLELPRNKAVYFFISHHHEDHYSPAILDYGADNVFFLAPRDVFMDRDDHHILIRPYDRINLGNLTVETLKSNDEGVAFIVQTEGISILHAGDLNDWRWPEETNQNRQENLRLQKKFLFQLEKVRGRVFDLAMIPCDPRLGANEFLGLEGWDTVCTLKKILPMHTFGNDSVIDRLIEKERKNGRQTRVLDLRKGPVEVE